MKTSTRLLLTCFFLVVFATGYGQTYNLHWGSTSWTAPTYSRTITNIGGSGIDATVTINNSSPAGNVSAATTATNDAFQYNTPAVGAVAASWYLPGTTQGNPLVQIVNWSNYSSNVTTTITFSRPVDNASFYLGDMDRTNPLSYVDRATITASKNGVAVPSPIITAFQANGGGGPIRLSLVAIPLMVMLFHLLLT